DLVFERSASLFLTTADFDFAKASQALANLRQAGDACVATSGVQPVEMTTTLTAEARYENQVWDIDVPVPHGRLDRPEDVAAFRSAFDDAHQAIFTVRDEASAVEVVGL